MIPQAPGQATGMVRLGGSPPQPPPAPPRASEPPSEAPGPHRGGDGAEEGEHAEGVEVVHHLAQVGLELLVVALRRQELAAHPAGAMRGTRPQPAHS
jgi:hypothetical protein